MNNKFRSLSIAALILTVGVAIAQFDATPAHATADSLVKNTNGFFAKRASDAKYYPAQLCFSTDGNQALIPCRVGGLGIVPSLLNAATSNIGTAAYTTGIASTAAAATWVSVYNPSASFLTLATGAAASEVDKLYIGASGWSGPFPLYLPAGTRVSLKSIVSTVSSGDVLINLIQ